MDTLLTLLLSGALFLALEYFWCRPTWRHGSAEAWREDDHQSGPPQFLPDWDPVVLSAVLHRLDLLAAELERLENDPTIFARAFRTQAVQSAQQALVADATRMAKASRMAAISPLPDTTIVEIEMANSLTPFQEELEV